MQHLIHLGIIIIYCALAICRKSSSSSSSQLTFITRHDEIIIDKISCHYSLNGVSEGLPSATAKKTIMTKEIFFSLAQEEENLSGSKVNKMKWVCGSLLVLLLKIF